MFESLFSDLLKGAFIFFIITAVGCFGAGYPFHGCESYPVIRMHHKQDTGVEYHKINP